IAEEVVVARRIAVHGRVAVPRRAIEPGLEPLRSTGVDELPHEVAVPAAERARCHGVLRDGRGPETEAVMVLGREDHHAESGGPGGARPLPGIERRWHEDARVLLPISPLAV